MNNKLITIGVAFFALILLFLFVNPYEYNDPTERTVVTRQNGEQIVRFDAGIFYAGFFAKSVEYPNQISVQYKDSLPPSKPTMEDNTIEVGQVNIRFNDATTAKFAGITQYILPISEKEMLQIHNAHKSPEALVLRRLAPYTQECLQSSAQLMSSEMHYSGGRSQMVQDYLDQLKNGAFLLKINTLSVYDSSEKMAKKTYEINIKTDKKTGLPERKFSSIKEYAINVGDAQITDVDYQALVDSMLAKKIASATKASIAKQDLMTAQQQKETERAKGEKQLVQTEYIQKIEQTKQVVAAETKVKIQEQYKLEQKMAAEAAEFAAKKVRTDADAESYKNRQLVSAGLSPWDKADFEMQTKVKVAEALSKTVWPTTWIQGGGNNGNNSGSSLNDIFSLLLLQQQKGGK